MSRGKCLCGLEKVSVQVPIFQSQHEELRKQHSDLEEEHRKQGEDFSRAFNDHKQRYLQLQQEKEQELSKLKGIRYGQSCLCTPFQQEHTQGCGADLPEGYTFFSAFNFNNHTE